MEAGAKMRAGGGGRGLRRAVVVEAAGLGAGVLMGSRRSAPWRP